MLVASAAMFFAVAGSAFILRARMIHCHRAAVTVPPPAVAPLAPEPPAPVVVPIDTATCGEPDVITDAHGNITGVIYGVCPGTEVRAVETPDGPSYATKIEDVQLR